MANTLSKALVILGLLVVVMQARAAPEYIELEAVLGSMAVVVINGQRQTLREGQTVDGVTLVSTQAATATVQINGATQTLNMSQRVGTAYQQRDEQVVTIARDSNMQYQTNATINGRSVLVLVDTGANMVALSATRATSMGINFSDGRPSTVETASGLTAAHGITLQSVVVGGIEVNNVPAMIVDGDYPATVLLGMSYLQHVKMQEHNGILSLSRSH